MAIGICLKDTFTYYLPGDELSNGLGSASCGYHSDTEKIKTMSPVGPTVEKYGVLDIVGCHLSQGEGKRKIQFYRNKAAIGKERPGVQTVSIKQALIIEKVQP